MTRIRNAVTHFQLGLVALLLACRVIASLAEGEQAPALRIDQEIETGEGAAPA